MSDEEPTATAAELIAQRRARGLRAIDLPWSPGIYFSMPDGELPPAPEFTCRYLCGMCADYDRFDWWAEHQAHYLHHLELLEAVSD